MNNLLTRESFVLGEINPSRLSTVRAAISEYLIAARVAVVKPKTVGQGVGEVESTNSFPKVARGSLFKVTPDSRYVQVLYFNNSAARIMPPVTRDELLPGCRGRKVGVFF